MRKFEFLEIASFLAALRALTCVTRGLSSSWYAVVHKLRFRVISREIYR